jgi:hypothetical protein
LNSAVNFRFWPMLPKKPFCIAEHKLAPTDKDALAEFVAKQQTAAIIWTVLGVAIAALGLGAINMKGSLP